MSSLARGTPRRDMGGRITHALLRVPALSLLGICVATIMAAQCATGLKVGNSRETFGFVDDGISGPAAQFVKRFDVDRTVVVALHVDDIFQQANFAALTRLTERLSEEPFLADVLSLANVEAMSLADDGSLRVRPLVDDVPSGPNRQSELRARALAEPLYLGNLISADASTAAVIARVRSPNELDTEPADVRTRLERIVSEEAARSGIRIYIAGEDMLLNEVDIATRQSFRRVSLAAMVIGWVITYGVVRSIPFVLLSAIVPIAATVWAFGCMALFGYPFTILSTVLPPLFIAVATCETIQLFVRYAEEYHLIGERRSAVAVAAAQLIRPSAIATVTTGVGFAALCVGGIPAVRQVGVIAAVGVSSVLVLTFALLVPLYPYLPVPRTCHGLAARQSSALDAALAAVCRFAVRRRRWVLLTALVLVPAAIAGVAQIDVGHVGLDTLPEDNRVVRDFRFIEEHLTGASSTDVIVRAANEDSVLQSEILSILAGLRDTFEARPEVKKVVSFADVISLVHRTLGGDEGGHLPESANAIAQEALLLEMGHSDLLPRFASFDYSAARAELRTTAAGTAGYRAVLGDVGEYLTAHLPAGFSWSFSGAAFKGTQTVDSLVSGQVQSLVVACLAIALLLACLLRSFPLAFAAIVAITYPILITYGYMGWAGIPLTIASTLVANVFLGLADDDTLHFLVRFREEVGRRGRFEDSMDATARSVGRAVLFAFLALESGYLVLALSPVVTIRWFGVLTGVAFAVGLVADLILLPAVLATLPGFPKAELESEERFAVEPAPVPSGAKAGGG